jgi:YegS/Rv2252/BmrU family lipid kinase
MSRKIAYLVNPVSGTVKKSAVIGLVEKATADAGIAYEVIPTNAAGNYEFIKDKIVANKITDIVMIGGDGTVNQVVNALRNCDVQFGIIPMGSGNGLAFAAGIPKKIKSSLELVFKGDAKWTDAFTVNGQFSCMLSGLGFDAKVAHEFATKASRGLITYTQQSILHYFKAQPYQFEVVVDDFSFFTDAFFISIANSNQFGNNFTIAPQASLSDGLLDVVIVQKMNKAKLPFAVLRQMRGNNKLEALVETVTKKNIVYFQTANLKIKNLKLAPFHIDGEPRATSDLFTIEVIKECFRLIQ